MPFPLPRCGTGAAGWRNLFGFDSHSPDSLGKVSQKILLNIPTEVIIFLSRCNFIIAFLRVVYNAFVQFCVVVSLEQKHSMT